MSAAGAAQRSGLGLFVGLFVAVSGSGCDAPAVDQSPTAAPAVGAVASPPPGAMTDFADAPSPENAPEVRCAMSPACGAERSCIHDQVKGDCVRDDYRQKEGPCDWPCRALGLCEHTPDGCRATLPRHCAEAGTCELDGHCTLFDGRCVAATDEDCGASADCASWGRCSAVRGTCVAADEDDCRAACVARGHCHPKDGFCQAFDDADCAEPCAREAVCKQQVAKMLGLSDGLVEVGTCGYAPDAPCAESEVCRREGRCKYLVTRDASHPHRAPTGQCVATEDGCRQSEECRLLGACHPGPGQVCSVVNWPALVGASDGVER